MSEKIGVIVVDHGSRREESNEMLLAAVAEFRNIAPYEIVEPAHMELAEPSIDTAFRACVTRGAKRVIVFPYFLLPGRHWSEDIPALAAAAAEHHPGVSYLVTSPLGVHPLMGAIMMDRINHCLDHTQGAADACQICSLSASCKWRSADNPA